MTRKHPGCRGESGRRSSGNPPPTAARSTTRRPAAQPQRGATPPHLDLAARVLVTSEQDLRRGRLQLVLSGSQPPCPRSFL